MKEIQRIFNYGGNEVRTVIVEGQPWFVAKDVASILGYETAPKMTRNLEDDEKLVTTMWIAGQNREITLINEYGLYSAILKSRREEARAFKRWITHEVIPMIRKTGGYVANEDVFIDTYLPHVDDATRLMFRTTLETVRKQNETISVMKPKVEAYETLIDADGTQSLAEIAKVLGYGRNTLTKELRDRDVLMTGTNHNIPYERFIKSGYFTVVETVKYGKAYPVTRVTTKGLGYLEKILKKAS